MFRRVSHSDIYELISKWITYIVTIKSPSILIRSQHTAGSAVGFGPPHSHRTGSQNFKLKVPFARANCIVLFGPKNASFFPHSVILQKYLPVSSKGMLPQSGGFAQQSLLLFACRWVNNVTIHQQSADGFRGSVPVRLLDGLVHFIVGHQVRTA